MLKHFAVRKMCMALVASVLALLGIYPDLTAKSAEPTVCAKVPGARLVKNYGSFVPDRTDAAATNTATINTAIDTVGRLGGGIICLPAGSYYPTRKNWTGEDEVEPDGVRRRPQGEWRGA